jgi:multiple sugar transport system substrate-binding protein
MSNRLRALLLGLAATAGALGATAIPAYAVDLTVTCRCVEGGANSNDAVFIKTKAIPAFTAANPDVNVKLNEFGGTDEQHTQQLALDFSSGAGSDVSGFDGFLVPSFVDGGLLKPLDEVAGPEVNDWEGWSHISQGVKALMSYEGKAYGIAKGTDVRMIFTRKDLLEKAGLPADWQPKSWPRRPLPGSSAGILAQPTTLSRSATSNSLLGAVTERQR